MTTATSPLPYLPADALRGAYRTLTTGFGPERDLYPVSVTINGRAYGAPVDRVHVTLRDLYFIHEQEARRFGTAVECPICAEDA